MLKSFRKLCSYSRLHFRRHVSYSPQRSFSNGTTATTQISAGMLARAQAIAADHAYLKKKLDTQYDSKVARKMGELSSPAEVFEQWSRARTALLDLEDLLKDPESDTELQSIARDEVDTTTKLLDQLSTKLIKALAPVHPFARLPCLIELRPGAGGSEAGLFAAELLRMYQNYCRRNKLHTNLLSISTSEVGGDDNIQEAIMKIEDDGSYGKLRCEAGVHRVQRVPATETKGRTHTSAVQVLVLPVFPEENDGDINLNDPDNEYYIHPSDVETETMRARGAGGQHVNTTDSAVRLRHLPSGLVVSVQESRSQQANRAKAWEILRSRFAQAKREEKEEEQATLRRGIAGKGKMDRGDKVRTYNWGQRRVTDHRSGITTHALDEVLEGGEALDEVMSSVRSWMLERDLQSLTIEEEQKQRLN